MKKLLNILNKVFVPQTIYAHCDIPCGIYDPYPAQIAAHTVIRMTSMIIEMKLNKSADELELKKLHQHLARLVAVKEKHAEIVEKELVTLWADYFKEEHLKSFPDLTTKIQQALKLASRTRQEINPEASEELLAKTMEIAEIFYQTKNRETTHVASPYPTEGEIVVPV